MQPNAVLWDVDGTLVDTGELHYQAWIALARQVDKPFTRADFEATFGWRNPEIIPKLWGEHLSAKEIDELGHRKEEIYRAEASKGVAPLPGVLRLIEELDRAGWLQAVGSSAPRRNLELILDMTGVHKFMPVVIGMEDTRRGKPDPDVFLQAARGLNVPPAHCVVLEDAPVGVMAAKAGGMRAIGVTFVGHHSEESLRQAGADAVVPCLSEVTVDMLGALLDQRR